MVYKVLTIAFILSVLLIQCQGQSFKETRLKKEDRKRKALVHYIGKDTVKSATISLILFKNKNFEYKYETPFDSAFITRGKFIEYNDTVILLNDLDLKIIPIGIEYKNIATDNNSQRKLWVLHDQTGKQYRKAMVWINNLRMGCMGGMAVCITGPGFEKIESLKVQIGAEVFSDWISVENNKKDIQLTVLSTIDLSHVAFLGNRKYVKRRKILKLL